MLGQQASAEAYGSTVISGLPWPPGVLPMPDFDAEPDDLAPARGFALGLLLGAGCLAAIGGAIWWLA